MPIETSVVNLGDVAGLIAPEWTLAANFLTEVSVSRISFWISGVGASSGARSQ